MKQLRSYIIIVALLSGVWLMWAGAQRLNSPSPDGGLRQAGALTLAHQPGNNQEATFTDATLLYRLCGSRQQRTISTNSLKTERTVTSHSALAKFHIIKPLYSHYDSRCRLETAPFCPSASRDYYVIALRRIIC